MWDTDTLKIVFSSHFNCPFNDIYLNFFLLFHLRSHKLLELINCLLRFHENSTIYFFFTIFFFKTVIALRVTRGRTQITRALAPVSQQKNFSNKTYRGDISARWQHDTTYTRPSIFVCRVFFIIIIIRLVFVVMPHS